MKRTKEDGYTLVLVIIISTSIFVLGIATTSVSFINYDMKRLNSISKRNFHIAEAGAEEAELILYEYIQEAIIYSYYEIYKYEEMIKLKGNSLEIENFYTEKRNNMFKEIYKRYANNIIVKLNDISEYNLNTQDGYNFLIESSISDIEHEDGIKFILTIKSSYEGMGVMERIISEYLISIPTYGENHKSKDLIEKIGWKNFKW